MLVHEDGADEVVDCLFERVGSDPFAERADRFFASICTGIKSLLITRSFSLFVIGSTSLAIASRAADGIDMADDVWMVLRTMQEGTTT